MYREAGPVGCRHHPARRGQRRGVMSSPSRTDALPGLAATSAIPDLDLKGVSDAIQAKTISSVEATEAYLRRIEQYDGVIQSYVTVTPDLALDAARSADAELARGESRGPLHGVP